MRIFVVGMPGAGNLGDDLISHLLINHVNIRWPEAEIGILIEQSKNHFSYPNYSNLTFLLAPRRNNWRVYWQRRKVILDFLKSTDLMLIGGGGLFQDTHNPFNIHNWLRYAFLAPNYSVAAVGVGFGPIRSRFSEKYLRKTLCRFSAIQVRDKDSQKLVEKLGYSSHLAPDIVLGSDLAQIPYFGHYRNHTKSIVGCSIRPWPGQSVEKVLALIASICEEENIRDVSFFVFEYAEPYNTVEYDYAIYLASHLKFQGLRVRVYCYNKDPIREFADALSTVKLAIASRFHANILWQKIGIPVVPLAYAPKVASLYSERGAKYFNPSMIDSQSENDDFQTIAVNDEYILPPSTTLNKPLRTSRNVEFFVKIVDMLETFYSIGYSIFWRARRTLKKE